MKRTIISVLIGVIALVVPGVASAHTGSVSCTTAGVVFHYDANFPSTTVVTQHVGNQVNTVTVPANTAVNFTVVPVLGGGNNTVVASATRPVNISVIPATSVTCPLPPTPPFPPVTPKPVCPPDTVQDLASSTDTYAICVKTVVNTITTPPTYITQFVDKWHTKTVVKWKTKTKYKTKIRLVPWCPLPPHKKSGVTG